MATAHAVQLATGAQIHANPGTKGSVGVVNEIVVAVVVALVIVVEIVVEIVVGVVVAVRVVDVVTAARDMHLSSVPSVHVPHVVRFIPLGPEVDPGKHRLSNGHQPQKGPLTPVPAGLATHEEQSLQYTHGSPM